MALTQVTTDVIANNTISSSDLDPNIYFPGRNRIINGDMRIDQRNAGASFSPTTASGFSLDRWVTRVTQNSKLTIQQNAGAVTPPTGYTNYLGVTSSSAYSVLSTDVFTLAQPIEGFNVADIGFGTAGAQSVTLSFWVRSSLTGSFGGALINSSANRSYPFPYTISAANTWTSISITIPGDTTGTWLTNNGSGIEVRFGLGAGSNFTGTANAWGTANAAQPPSTVSVVGTNGATFYITGVQLEAGSVATSFERRSYGQELALCQRYYQRTTQNGSTATAFVNGTIYNSTNAYGVYHFKTTMRVAPSGSASSTNALTVYAGGAGYASSNIVIQISNSDQCEVFVTISGATTGQSAFMRLVGTNSWIDFSAEL